MQDHDDDGDAVAITAADTHPIGKDLIDALFENLLCEWESG